VKTLYPTKDADQAKKVQRNKQQEEYAKKSKDSAFPFRASDKKKEQKKEEKVHAVLPG